MRVCAPSWSPSLSLISRRRRISKDLCICILISRGLFARANECGRTRSDERESEIGLGGLSAVI